MLPIHIDCRHYKGSSPCCWHKRDGRPCAGCHDYDPIRERLLVVKLAALGDVLRTTSVLPALARTRPGAHITWITEPAAVCVLDGNPLIDRVLTTETCLPALLTETFAAVYGLDTDPRSAGFATLARAEQRFGYVCDRSGRVVPADEAAVDWWLMGLDDGRKRANRRTYQELMYELCGLVGPVDRPQLTVPEEDRRCAAAFMNGHDLIRYSSVLGLNTGGGSRWAAKKWTEDGYDAFIRAWRTRHPESAVLLLGGPDEERLNARLVSRHIEGVFDPGCSNAIAHFAALVAAVDVLVTSDSLGLHVATAVATPSVVIVGPTSPWELELYGQGAIVHADVPCLACYLAACDKPVTCMEQLVPETVLAAVERTLAGRVDRSLAVEQRERTDRQLPVVS